MTETPATFAVTDGTVTARIVGSGTRTIVFVHGIMVNGSVWDPIVEPLARDNRLALLDLPLGGHSSPLAPEASGELEAHAQRVLEVVDELDGPVVLVGSDTGGAVAQLAAVARPELFEALVLLPSDAFDNCPPLLLRPLRLVVKVPGAIPGIASMLRFSLLQGMLMTLVSRRRHSSEVLERLLGDLPRNPGVQRDLTKLIRGLRPDVTRQVAEQLASFDRPVLIVWSKRDPLFPERHAHALGKAFPDSRVALVDESRAFVSLDQPEWLATQILEFLDTIPGSTR